MAHILKQQGLTLIEVLVATMILALVLIGVLTTASHVANTSFRLHEKTLAHWVAQNAAAELRLGLLGEMTKTGGSQGQSSMGYETFNWQAKTQHANGMIAMQVNVTRPGKKQSLATVYTYLPEEDS